MDNPFGLSNEEIYTALDKAWRSIINYDMLHPAEKSDWDRKLAEIEGSNINYNALHQFIKLNFSETQQKKIYARANKFRELMDKKNKERKKKEDKEIKSKLKEYKPKLKPKYYPTEEMLAIAEQKFNQPDLILEIRKELDKKHLEDNKEKLTCFIGCCTAYLEPEDLHKSMAILGDSSVGKDNLIKTCLSNLPSSDWIFLTNATQSAMEDDISDYRIIAYSEMNKNREEGANSHLVETLKQMTEGGTSAIKKDISSGYKDTKFISQKQKTVIYGTTETEDDEELSTRFVKLSIKGDPTKTKKVNDNTLNIFAGDFIKNCEDSWISAGITTFKHNKVILPYATYLKNKIGDKDIFDSSNPRSMRDLKRLLAFTSAITWLYQKQREIKDNCIISDPFDFLLAIVIVGDFFNHTYSGVGDIRIRNLLDVFKKYETEHLGEVSVPRTYIQEELGVVRNTSKRYLKVSIDLGLVEYVERIGNVLYYKRCQKGVKKVLLGVNLEELKTYLEAVQGVKINKECCDVLNLLQKEAQIELIDTHKNKVTALPVEIDTLKLTPCVEEEVK